MAMPKGTPLITPTKSWAVVLLWVQVACALMNASTVCITSRWCHNGRDGVSNQRRLDCLLNRSIRQMKENIKVPHHWPLWGESAGHRWIPLIKDQKHWKCFHLMTSSWTPFQYFNIFEDISSHKMFICVQACSKFMALNVHEKWF